MKIEERENENVREKGMKEKSEKSVGYWGKHGENDELRKKREKESVKYWEEKNTEVGERVKD